MDGTYIGKPKELSLWRTSFLFWNTPRSKVWGKKLIQIILQYLKNTGEEGSKRDGIYEYLKDVLPQNKTREQQLRMFGDLLNSMKDEKLIIAKGRTWYECSL